MERGLFETYYNFPQVKKNVIFLNKIFFRYDLIMTTCSIQCSWFYNINTYIETESQNFVNPWFSKTLVLVKLYRV